MPMATSSKAMQTSFATWIRRSAGTPTSSTRRSSQAWTVGIARYAASPMARADGCLTRSRPIGLLDEAQVRCSVIYPTNALAYGFIKDREWANALARAYNMHVATDYVAADPARLRAIALIPLQ